MASAPVDEKKAWTPDTVAEAIIPTLDAFVAAAEPTCRKLADSIYTEFLSNVQDYLRSDSEWNIREDIRRCRATELENIRLRDQQFELVDVLRQIDKDWTETFPDGPDGSREWCGGIGKLSDETCARWSRIRTLLAKIGGAA